MSTCNLVGTVVDLAQKLSRLELGAKNFKERQIWPKN